MPPKNDPIPRARAAAHWLGGILVLGILLGGTAAAAVALWEHVDIRRLTRAPAAVLPAIPAPPPAARPVLAPEPFEAAVFWSAASAKFYPEQSHYAALVGRWEAIVRDAGGATRRVQGARGIADLGPHLLIVPGAVCLSQAEREALGRHIDGGGGLVLEWATGSRDERCSWLGWQTLRALTQAEEIHQLETRDAVFLTVPAALPLTAGIDPGVRVELRPESQLALSVRGPRVYWSDWALNPAPARGSGADAAVWFREARAGGRLVWFGFHASSAAQPDDDQHLRALLRNGILWAGRLPVADPAPWPDGKRAALLITQDVESGFASAESLAAVVRGRDAAATFFVVSQLAMEHPRLAPVLAAAGEIGAHTSDHAPVVGLPYLSQWVRLRRNWNEVQAWAGTGPTGFRPPEEEFDAGTLRAWRRAGGTYLVAVNSARSASPEIFHTPEGPVVVLPRVLKDDYNVFVQDRALRTERLKDAYLAGMGKVAALGGVAVISLRTQMAGQPSRVGLMAEVLDTAQASGAWWIATGHDASAWWLDRAGISVRVRSDTSDERHNSVMEVVVRNEGRRPASGVVVEVYVPRLEDVWTVTAGGAPLTYSRTPWALRLPVDTLEPGAGRTFILRARR